MLKTNFITIDRNIYAWGLVFIIVGLQACSTNQPNEEEVSVATATTTQKLPPGPIPKVEPKSRYGNPSSYVVFGKRYHTLPTSDGYVERGIASWYGKKFHGRRTSSGEPYDMYAMTAAHTQLPLPTYAQVTNLKNGRQIIVRVNDRGPFHHNRIIDLSYTAATKLDIVRDGTGLVEVRALDPLSYQYVIPSNDSAKVVTEVKATSTPLEGQQQTANVNSVDPRVFVQVGAFGDRANADQLVNQLNNFEIGDVTISSVVQNQKELHRVRIGPLSTVQSADDTVAKLIDIGMTEHRVVIE